MALRDLSFNPFCFEKAKEAWENPNSTTQERIINTTSGALRDIYIENPHKLTFGNASQFSSDETNARKAAIIALTFVGACYGLMLYGSSTYLVGKLTLTIGSASPHLSFVATSGKVVQTVGRKIFLTGAVPLYATFYALPKKFIEITPAVIRSIANKVSLFAKWVFEHTVVPLWNHVIYPAIDAFAKAINYTFNTLSSLVQYVGTKVQALAKLIFDYLIHPIWKYLLKPMITFTVNLISSACHALSKAVEFAATTISHLASWVFRSIITPIWNHVISPTLTFVARVVKGIGSLINQTLTQIASMVVKTASWVFTNLISPLWSHLIKPVFTYIAKSASAVLSAGVNAYNWTANIVCKIASWVFNNFLVPCLKAIGSAISFVANVILDNLLLPVGKVLYFIMQKVSSVAHTIFQKLIAPIGQAVANITSAIATAIGSATYSALEGISTTWREVASYFAF